MKLKPTVEKVITLTAIIEGILILSISDFEWGGLPIVALLVSSFLLNIKILKKYGKNLLTNN